MVEVYTDDAISLASGAPMVRGKAAIEEFWTRYLQDASSLGAPKNPPGTYSHSSRS